MNRDYRIVANKYLRHDAADDVRTVAAHLRKTYVTQGEAETAAETLAKDQPGCRFSVYELVSSYVADTPRREMPDDLKSEAQEKLRDDGAQDFGGGHEPH